MTTVSIIGGSGYGGGELLRLLLGHPNVEIKQVTSRSKVGEYVYQTHPNLRKKTQLKFSDPSQLEPVDILFLAQPHGQAQKNIDEYAKLQKSILNNVIVAMKTGGYFLYITCSVFKKENEDAVNFLLEKFNLKVLKMELLKGYELKADTMFVALLQKQL